MKDNLKYMLKKLDSLGQKKPYILFHSSSGACFSAHSNSIHTQSND